MRLTLTTAQTKLIAEGVFATSIRNHGLSNSRAHAVAMYVESADVYGLTGDDRRWVIGWCLAQSGYGGGF